MQSNFHLKMGGLLLTVPLLAGLLVPVLHAQQTLQPGLQTMLLEPGTVLERQVALFDDGLSPMVTRFAEPNAMLALPWEQKVDGLPAAPSALLEQQDRMVRPAGSGVVFHAAGVIPAPAGAPKVMVEQASETLPLSLDDAISIGLARNIRILYDQQQERAAKGYTGSGIELLLPNLTVSAQSSALEVNLAAMGFKPSLLAGSGLLPAGTTIAQIVKVNTTQASINLNQALFNLPDFELYRTFKTERDVVALNTLNDRGDVVISVGQAYLKIIADRAAVANAQAQELSAKTVFGQATARRDAGVGTNLDRLRGQVDYQQRQQQRIAAEAQVVKDTVQLARILGIPAGQQLELTDTAPFHELDGMDLELAKTTAYAHRKDLLALEGDLILATRTLKAVKYQRLPTLAFNGFYGVLGETTGVYHGVFNAIGSLNVPVFREASQRGEQEVIDAQLVSLRQQDASLRVTIEAQIRSAMLDVQAAGELVKVADSNVTLSKQELSDARERFTAGVDDNLPTVDAEATLANAQANEVQSLYQFNVAKLQLARAIGVVESRYRGYLAGTAQ